MAAQEYDFGLPPSMLVADDRILQAGLASRAAAQQVLLLTNDTALRLKVCGWRGSARRHVAAFVLCKQWRSNW